MNRKDRPAATFQNRRVGGSVLFDVIEPRQTADGRQQACAPETARHESNCLEREVVVTVNHRGFPTEPNVRFSLGVGRAILEKSPDHALALPALNGLEIPKQGLTNGKNCELWEKPEEMRTWPQNHPSKTS
jgi:hypothetical protein